MPSVYTVSMPSVYPQHSGTTTSLSTLSASVGPTATVASTTGMACASSHGKGYKGSSKTTVLKAKESKSKATGRTEKSPAKRCKTKAKVQKPATKSKYN